MKKTIRSMQGKAINFEELALRNEKVSAVGNMNVNAAGDEIKTNTLARKKRNQGKNFRRQINNKVIDVPVMNSRADVDALIKQYADAINDASTIDGIDTITNPEPTPVTTMDEADAIFGKRAEVLTAPDFPVNPPIATTDKTTVSEELLQEVINRKSSGGLAGAIAKAKDVKHGPIKSPREQLRASDGVRKI